MSNQLCIFKQCEMSNAEISGVARRYLIRIIFVKFLQINNHILYLLAAQKNHFWYEIFVSKPLENKAL